MAFAVASKGAPLAGLLKNLLVAAPSSSALRPASSLAAARRHFSTGGTPFSGDDYYVQSIGDEFVFYHQLHARVFFAHPMFVFAHPMFSSAGECQWSVSKQDENAVQVKVEMPGLASEHVKVRADPKGLLIKGEGVKDLDDVQEPARYSCRIDFPADAFRVNQARAQMKDGVLKVTVPRVKEDLGDCTEIEVR